MKIPPTLRSPLTIAIIVIVVSLVAGEMISRGFASPAQLRSQLVIAAVWLS